MLFRTGLAMVLIGLISSSAFACGGLYCDDSRQIANVVSTTNTDGANSK